jgi:hypothetical protein
MSNRFQASRFNKVESPYAQDYIKNIEESYAGFGEAAGGFAKQFQDLKATEARAKALVPDADFTSDLGPNSAFSADAQKLMDKINGNAEGSYNFLNPADLERFNSDVAALKKEMNDFEPIYNEAVANLQQLSLEHDLFMKVGGDPRQAVSQEINGVEYYNAKAGTLAFDETMKIADALRYGEVRTGDDGKVTVVDQNGQTVSEYGSRQDYLKAIVELGKPDLQPIPVTDGKTLVEEKRWGSYDTATKAESAFLNYVLNNPAIADRRRREKLGLTGPEPEGAEMSEEVQALLAKHPKTSEGFDNMSQAQYDYLQEMMQGWRDLQEVEKPKTSGSSSTDKAGEFGSQMSSGEITLSVNPDDPDGETINGTSAWPLKGAQVRIGYGKPLRAEKIIYNGRTGSYVLIAADSDGVAKSYPFRPFEGEDIVDALVASLDVSQKEIKDAFGILKNKGAVQ